MARSPRIDFPSAVHHVFGRGNGKQTVFLDDEDCSFFARRLGELKHELKFRVFAYCLMTNHYHLVIQTAEVALCRIMHRLLTAHARVFNDRWASVGHTFQGRYGSRLIGDDNALRTAIRYVHLNPVEAHLVPHAAAWTWTGHHGVLTGRDGLIERAFVLDLFGGSNEGYQAFLSEKTAKVERPSLDMLAAESPLDGASDLIRGAAKTKQATDLRQLFAEEALRVGYRRSELAAYLNRSQAALSKLLRRRS